MAGDGLRDVKTVCRVPRLLRVRPQSVFVFVFHDCEAKWEALVARALRPTVGRIVDSDKFVGTAELYAVFFLPVIGWPYLERNTLGHTVNNFHRFSGLLFVLWP